MRNFLLVALCFSVLRIPVAKADYDPALVEKAIADGVAALYARQEADGTWESKPPPAKPPLNNKPDEGQWGGQTAIAVYALLVCGEKATAPKLQKAVEFLKTAPITGTYAVALKCLVWSHLPATADVKRAMVRDAGLLRSMAIKHKSGLPVWGYGPGNTTSYSLSRVQYATLGLWSASEMGVETPLNDWKLIEKTWEQSQAPEGGWKYQFAPELPKEPLTVSLTAAAVASLYITEDFTKGDFYANAKGNAQSDVIDRGLKWMTANFKAKVATVQKLDREFPYAQLYAIERVSLASGIRRFGEFDWFEMGSEYLLKRQSKGLWTGEGPMPTVANTSWALLFLARGRTPVAFNKLDYSDGVADAKTALWNQRPRDVANVTGWLTRSLERELRWQVVRSDSSIEALLEAPVLYIAGEGEFAPNEQLTAKLKSYVQSGGLILFHADTGDSKFASSVIEFGTRLLPPNEWRSLPESHPLLSNQNYKFAAMRTKPVIKGLSNGVRETMLLIPSGDPARGWQLRNPNQRTEQWQLAADILSYAVDKTHFSPRGQSNILPPTKVTATKTVTVGRLDYGGNWDPEPQAMVQLARATQLAGKIDVKTVVVKAGQPIEKVDLLFVTGTDAFQLDEATRTAIKTYTDGGGTVMFEAAGGSGLFASSAEGELTQMFGRDNIKVLPPDHAIYKAAPPAEAGSDKEGDQPSNAKLVPEYRPFQIMSIANPTVPQVRGAEKDGRVYALFSREDLSAGLVGVTTDGIIGYTPASARRLMAGIVSYVAKNAK